MRRSKSDPAKYARNYRSISQRRMTEHDAYNEEAEMERLKEILLTSEAHLMNDKEDKRQREEPIRQERTAESSAYGQDEDDDLIVMPKKKKAKKQPCVELTQQEIRKAKLVRKNATRKLKQLSDRAEQKQKRTELYSKLKDTAISNEERDLLSSSSTLGKRETKREALKRLLQKERIGLSLTNEERDLLYSERGDGESFQPVNAQLEQNDVHIQAVDVKQGVSKSKIKEKANSEGTGPHEQDGCDPSCDIEAEKISMEILDTDDEPTKNNHVVESKSPDLPSAPAPIDLVAQMMASFTSLKSRTDEENKKVEKEPSMSELERIALNEEKQTKVKAYVPTNPVLVKTAATLGLKPNLDGLASRRVLEIKRPSDVEAKRFDLPVSSMEFEIMDAIRNNDVTILCSETGSGKSTQAPQFLYEAGFTLGCGGEDLLIGITQPRRVAAVSTAKRVCYEMGQGDGQSIRGKSKVGNLVAYQTRYESAGLGEKTRIKFMTDGILLQEIQSDLLLRKYGVIVLDEAHERNLNTDVLLGLLSVAIPLRRKASEEKGSNIRPLKLVVMSATLRIEDFTENDKLFPTTKPAVIRVPGRTHPVTIHHSKVTELDDYERLAYKKVLKIHQKLPKGGILLFLTGKQEIIRTVKKLRKRLKAKETRLNSGLSDVKPADAAGGVEGFRDMDDDDIDGDIFQDDADDDFNDDEDSDDETEVVTRDDDDDGIPKQALVLPLYSMLSVEEQAAVFSPVPEGVRLIVVTTNIAETSLTIPGISYVVDCGRQKCRNYHASTGVASYNIMWISKAAADQRAGRAGRTGPGHCYRLYSSSMYTRHMEDFAIPEVLTRPLEDVVLAMKAMSVTNVSKFPFPTAPDQSQIDAALKCLANLGCLDITKMEETGEDGKITRLGASVAQLPLGVRYGKMLLVAAQAGVLDYAIAMVAVLSEDSPFSYGQQVDKDDEDSGTDENKDVQAAEDGKAEKECLQEIRRKWRHEGGDIMAGTLAVGAYSYAGQGASGSAENAACKQFCVDNGLIYSVMVRIQKMRLHLARLAQQRLASAGGVAARTGGIVSSMRPPNKLEENLLCQSICSGLLDNVAMIAPAGSFSGDHPFGFRSAYISCTLKEPLFMDQRSAVYTRDFRRLPQWICFDTLVRKTANDGTPFVRIKNITPIDARWLGMLSKGSRLLSTGEPLVSPPPTYDPEKDAVLCCVQTKYGSKGWEIPAIQVPLYDVLQKFPSNKAFQADDSFRYFARFLLEGKAISEFKVLKDCWNDDPSIITRKAPIRKVGLLVAALSSAGVDSASALRQYWAETDRKFLFQMVSQSWTKSEHSVQVKNVWMEAVKRNIKLWKTHNARVD
jgi:ATP-dependent RNA helicase DHX37/DHR1